MVDIQENGWGGKAERHTWSEVFACIWRAKWALMVPVIILGGIYGGIMTATEASAVAALYGLFVGIFVLRGIDRHNIVEIIVECVVMCAAVMLIVAMAHIFGYVMAIEQIPDHFARMILGFTSDRVTMLLMVNVFLLIVGALMDPIVATIILAPILVPGHAAGGSQPAAFRDYPDLQPVRGVRHASHRLLSLCGQFHCRRAIRTHRPRRHSLSRRHAGHAADHIFRAGSDAVSDPLCLMRLASENIGLPVPQKRRKHMFANLETGNSTGYYIHSLICVVLMFGLGHLPAPSPITPTGMHVVGIFIGMIYGWLTVGMTWPSILGITALGFSGRMTVVQAFQSGFGNNTILLIFFMFIITGVLDTSGVARYVANRLVSFRFSRGRPGY